jgi:hypothetical protein
MTIEQLWEEMEVESRANVAWLTRFATSCAGLPLLVALEQATRARALLVPVTNTAIPPSRDLPECHGLEIISVMLDLQPYFGVRLRDVAYVDVFTVLAEDVAPRVAVARDTAEAVAGLLDRLRQWQHFLTAAREGMSVEVQRGLWGELHVLKEHILPVFGAKAAVCGWKASSASHQDFQFSTGAIEVKSTAAKQPQSIRITSERQLDETGVGSLFLHIVVLDEREVEEGEGCEGKSLPKTINEIRAIICNETNTLSAFNDRLTDRGWIDSFADRYAARRWTVRRELSYRVQNGFPRLVEANLPAGVGDVNFSLSMAACEPFVASTQDMVKELYQTSAT